MSTPIPATAESTGARPLRTITSTSIDAHQVPTIVTTTVVVGTGSAGYCAADRLVMAGHTDLIVIADKIRAGASRNAGSDKQTYYKLSLGGDAPDSVADLAATLFAGGAMDGDNALAEAANSARAFAHLVDAGVPFPTDRFGQFIGYKTDHDPRERATSIGPYTSKSMTERLEARVRAAGVPIMEGCRVIDLVVDRSGSEPRVVGLLVMNKTSQAAELADTEPAARFLLIRASNVVYATGGPAGIYADSVYPHGQWGATGAALRAGAPGKNLTEWQFGLASIAPRWNVSGSYMQVIPRFISTNADGGDEREFLSEAIDDPGVLGSLVFLKGYQWPFDARKAADGSSLIDLLVHRETVLRGRRVWLDFRTNAGGAGFDITKLSAEAQDYLRRTGVSELSTDAPPVDRLRRLNQAAYDFYLERGPRVDLATEPLEIAVSAQHNNGGLEVDAWWRSPLSGLYPVGEAAGAHGVYRPGGAALNSGQVGAMRAAEWIAHRGPQTPPDEQLFTAAASHPVRSALELVADAHARFTAGAADNTGEVLTEMGKLMSSKAGLVRSAESVHEALAAAETRLANYGESMAIDAASRRSVDRLFLVRDIVTTQYVYLTAMADYLDHGGRSRGSVLYTDPAGSLPVWNDSSGGPVAAGLDESFRFVRDDGALDGVTQIVVLQPVRQNPAAATSGAGNDASMETAPAWTVPPISCTWRPVRPLPNPQEPFEVVWRGYRADRNVQ